MFGLADALRFYGFLLPLLKRLEKYAAESGKVLTESQVQALEAAKEEKQAHGEIETFHPGFLLGQDTYYVGYIKGVGKIYQQTGIDTYSNVGFAKLYTDPREMWGLPPRGPVQNSIAVLSSFSSLTQIS